MTRYVAAACWAIAMLVMAAGAKLEWIERDAALTLLFVMPVLAVITIQRGGRGGCCAPRARDA